MAKKSAEFKTTFRIDDERLIGLVGNDARRALMRLGGWIRVTAQRSMRRVDPATGKPSRPGDAPRAREGILRLKVEFAYDTKTNRLVVGPEIVRRNNKGQPESPNGVPNLMEFGGFAVVGPYGWWIVGWKYQKQTDLQGNKSKKLVQYSKTELKPGERLTYLPRPFMRPAFKKSQDQEKLKQFWEAL